MSWTTGIIVSLAAAVELLQLLIIGILRGTKQRLDEETQRLRGNLATMSSAWQDACAVRDRAMNDAAELRGEVAEKDNALVDFEAWKEACGCVTLREVHMKMRKFEQMQGDLRKEREKTDE